MKFSLSEENRNLQLKLAEEHEKYIQQKKHLSDKIIDLENKISDLEFLNAEQSINLKALEEELINKNSSKRPDSSTSTKTQCASRQSSNSCFTLHTSSISGINDYISLLAKAKDDVINYKKESAQLLSELELCKRKLSAKNNEIETLKSELDYINKLDASSRKICICHEVDSSYESFEDSTSESHLKEKNVSKQTKFCKSKSNCLHCKSNVKGTQCDDKNNVSDAAIQVNDIESIVKSRLDEYIRKAKDIVPGTLNENHIINTLEEERDYYCREYHRLKDKVLHIFRHSDAYSLGECPHTILNKINSELRRHREEIEELRKICKTKKDPVKQYDSSTHNLEEWLRKFESRESELSSVNDKLANKIRKLEDQCSDYRDRIRVLTKENSQQKSVYSQVRMMQEDSERSLFNAQDALRKSDSELNCALAKINLLEEENARLKRDLSFVENEKKCLKKNLVQLDHKKDEIVMKLDEKTELVVRLEKELNERKKRASDLEHKVNKLEESLKILQNINMKTEETARHTKKSYSSMHQELNDLQRSKETLIIENRRLQDNLSAAVRDCFQSNNELQTAKAEVEDLKNRLQSYVSEVRRIEDILQVKEDERRCMLEQLKGLNVEYSSNNSKSRTRDNSDNVILESLSDFRERFRDYGGGIGNL